MERNRALVIEVAQGSALERGLRRDLAGGRDEVVIVGMAADPEGSLPPPEAEHVVVSVPSPEALAEEPDAIRRAIEDGGAGVEPMLIVVDEAEELREEELAPVIAATQHASRDVILRVIHALDG